MTAIFKSLLNAQNLQDAALALYDFGFSIIPLKSHSKQPFFELLPNQKWRLFQNKRASRELVKKWWDQCSTANIGILCGNGLVVIDADTKASVDFIRKTLPPAWITVSTHKGAHFYYAQDNNTISAQKITNSSQDIHIDVKAYGGYVVGPLSKHELGTTYIIETVKAEGAYLVSEHLTHLKKCLLKNCLIDLKEVLPDFADSKKTIAKIGNRNNTLASIIGKYIAQGVSKDKLLDIALEINQQWEPPLSDQEVQQTVNSVIRTHERKNPEKPVNISITHIAQKEFEELPISLLPSSGLLRDITIWIEKKSKRSALAFSLFGAISFISAITSRLYKDMSGTRTNLFTVAIGPSGCGKDNVLKCITELATQCRMVDLIAQGIGSDAGLVNTMMLCPSKLFLMDELGKIFSSILTKNAASYKAQIVSKLLTLYSASDSIYREDELVSRQPRCIREPHLNIYGATTPEEFYAAFTTGHSVVNGTVGRLCVVETTKVNRLRDLDDYDTAIPSSIIEKICLIRNIKDPSQNVNLILDLMAPPHYSIIDFTDDAKNEFKTIANSYDKEAEKGRQNNDYAKAAIKIRAYQHIKKLALIASISESPVNKINSSHVQWAKSLTDWMINNLLVNLKKWTHKTKREEYSKDMLSCIKKNKKGISPANIAYRFIHIPPQVRDSILNDLVYSGLVSFDSKLYTIN